MSGALTSLTVSVTIDPPERLILKNWDDAAFLVDKISADFYFRDGGFTRQRIESTGFRLKKDGTPGKVPARSNWSQDYSPEVRRRLKVAVESIAKRAAKSEVPA